MRSNLRGDGNKRTIKQLLAPVATLYEPENGSLPTPEKPGCLHNNRAAGKVSIAALASSMQAC